jgi:formamidopyrimidine-DNA glycosylase
MPELPEVEVTRRSIAADLHGARVHRVETGLPLRWPLGCAPESLSRHDRGRMSRRGKYLWLPLTREPTPEFDPPASPGCLRRPRAAASGAANGAPLSRRVLIHLGCPARCRSAMPSGSAGPYDHFRLVTTADACA